MSQKWPGSDPVEDGRRAGQTSKKHGMGALRERGRAALDPAEVPRLDDLRELLRSQPGRSEVREELAARVFLIVDRGFRYLASDGEQHFRKGTGPIKYLGIYSNLLARLLDNWPDPLAGAKYAGELDRIREVIEEHADED